MADLDALERFQQAVVSDEPAYRGAYERAGFCKLAIEMRMSLSDD